MKTYLHKVS